MAQPTITPFITEGDSVTARELAKLLRGSVRTIDRILQADPLAPRPVVPQGSRRRIFSKSQWGIYLAGRQAMGPR
jgi:hypothetical protein